LSCTEWAYKLPQNSSHILFKKKLKLKQEADMSLYRSQDL